MDITTLAAVWAAIIATLAFIAYLLVEYPRMTANWKALNATVIKFSQNKPKSMKFIALVSLFGSEAIALVLLLLLIQKDYSFGWIEWLVLVAMLGQFIFWIRRIGQLL